jgi:uncharacterized protein involved in cysteine biosynthesis
MQKPSRAKLSRTESFWFGFKLPAKSARLAVKKPVLLFWSAIPIALTVVTYRYLIRVLNNQAEAWMTGLFNWLKLDSHHWAYHSLNFLSQAAIWAFSILTFGILATLVGSPFNDLLAESAETRVNPPLSSAPRLKWAAKLRLIWIDLLKSSAAALMTVVTLLVSWIPVVNLASAIITLLLFTFQYLSYPQTRRQLGLLESAAYLWRYSYSCLGFGLAVSLGFAIPLVGFLTVPLAVIGGTWLFSAQYQPKNATGPLLR